MDQEALDASYDNFDFNFGLNYPGQHEALSFAFPDPFSTGLPPLARPGMTAPAQSNEVIDLTDSPPRETTNDVIDLDTIPDRPTLAHSPASFEMAQRERARSEARRELRTNTRNGPAGEVNSEGRRQWVYQQAQARQAARAREIVPAESAQARDRRLINQAQRMFPSMQSGAADMVRLTARQGFSDLSAYIRRSYTHAQERMRHDVLPDPTAYFRLVPPFQAPNLNYGSFPPDNYPPIPKYVKPDPPKEPFTRTFSETDILICPRCQCELGGEGDEQKRRLYVTKCSHVYCGDCGLEIKSLGKGKGVKCIAPNCNTAITKSRIFEAYV